MKKQIQFSALFFLIITLFSSCEAIGTIFKAGMGFGIFIVVIIVIAIIFVISKFAGKK